VLNIGRARMKILLLALVIAGCSQQVQHPNEPDYTYTVMEIYQRKYPGVEVLSYEVRDASKQHFREICLGLRNKEYDAQYVTFYGKSGITQRGVCYIVNTRAGLYPIQDAAPKPMADELLRAYKSQKPHVITF
jgi:hypothetical protein